MRLKEFLLELTNVGEICYITESGYNLAMCLIDCEDLFIRGMSEKVLNKTVVKSNYDTLKNVKFLHIEVKEDVR